MVCCAVPACKNTSAKISKDKDGITFHRFPRDSNRRRLWEIAVNRDEDWFSTVSSAVCSEHFDTKDFYITQSGLRRLSTDAVPSINISICQSPEPTISQLSILNSYPIDVEPTDSDEVVKLKQKVQRLEVIAEYRRRRLKYAWQDRRRLKRKLDSMKSIIKHLIRFKQEKQLEIR